MKLTHAQMDKLTRGELSRKNYQIEYDDLYLIGKYAKCDPNPDGETWDVWLCNPKNMEKGLTRKRVRSIKARIEALGRVGSPFRELDGEGVWSCMPTDTLLSAASCLGLRRKRRTSEKQLAEMTARLKALREEKNHDS